jgi:hypothetical protein
LFRQFLCRGCNTKDSWKKINTPSSSWHTSLVEPRLGNLLYQSSRDPFRLLSEPYQRYCSQ